MKKLNCEIEHAKYGTTNKNYIAWNHIIWNISFWKWMKIMKTCIDTVSFLAAMIFLACGLEFVLKFSYSNFFFFIFEQSVSYPYKNKRYIFQKGVGNTLTTWDNQPGRAAGDWKMDFVRYWFLTKFWSICLIFGSCQSQKC